MEIIPPPPFRPLIPNSRRRKRNHDYRSRCIYLITINCRKNILPLSRLKGSLGSHDFPPHTEPTEIGRIIKRQLSLLKERFPFIQIRRSVIMPEHIHFVIFITEKTDLHLGKIIGAFKKACTEEIDALHVMAPGGVFEEGYNDRILRGKNQLQRMLDYVSNNPRKRMERISFRGFHCRHFIANSSGERFEAYGNIQLLEDFDCCSVKISSKYSSEKLIALKKQWLFTILNGGVIVSPFISEQKKG